MTLESKVLILDNFYIRGINTTLSGESIRGEIRPTGEEAGLF